MSLPEEDVKPISSSGSGEISDPLDDSPQVSKPALPSIFTTASREAKESKMKTIVRVGLMILTGFVFAGFIYGFDVLLTIGIDTPKAPLLGVALVAALKIMSPIAAGCIMMAVYAVEDELRVALGLKEANVEKIPTQTIKGE